MGRPSIKKALIDALLITAVAGGAIVAVIYGIHFIVSITQ